MDRQAIRLEQGAPFHERADTFELNVTLLAEQRLIITIKDFVDWIIYSKEYKEDDIGKEITRKMDLVDVYTAFTQTKPQCDEERMKEKENQESQLKRYEFGTVIENVSKKLPCYKIEKGGRITTYLSMLDKRLEKDIVYESNLTLKKIRVMTQAEIETEKSRNENNLLFEELKKKMQDEIKEKEKVAIKLKEENDRLRAKDDKIQIEINFLKKEYAALNQKLRQKVNLVTKELEQTKQQLADCKKIKKAKQDFDGSEIVVSNPYRNTKPLVIAQQANFTIKIIMN